MLQIEQGFRGVMCVAAGVLCVMAASSAARAAIKTQTIEYKDGETNLKGFVAYDDSIAAPRPGVLVVPEWWGLTDYPRHRAEMLAQLGYVAFVADMYGEGKTTDDPKVAGEWSGAVKKDPALMRRRAQAGLAELVKQPNVDRARLAAIGYCFGGSTILELARGGDELQKASMPLLGIVSFHGGLPTVKADDLKQMKAKVLIETGAEDPAVPLDSVMAYESALKQAGVDYDVTIYSKTRHAFTNPDADRHHIPIIAYNATADHRSWAAMKNFFAEIFGTAEGGK